MKRVISLLLVCCFLALALVACGGGKEKETKAPETNTNEVLTDIYGQTALTPKIDLSTLDFEGETLTVMVRNDEKVSREWEKEDVGDDELDLAIANRNEVVEGDLNLNVEIELVANSEHGNCVQVYTQLITQDIDNNLHDFDIAAHFAYAATEVAIRDYNVNLLDTDTLPYFNFDLMCWNQTIVNNTQANGKLYFASGDLNLSLFDSAMILWHNKDLYEKVRDDDDPKDIQDLILAGDWTYSELYKWAQYYNDSDDATDCGDIYGVHLEGVYITNPNDAIPYAWDLEIVKTNPDGTHYYNIVGNSKISEAMTKYRNMYKAEGNDASQNVHCTCGVAGGHFVAGDRLFVNNVLFWDKASNLAIREMEDKYSIVPHPKYDESQANYGSTSMDYYTLMSVLDHAKSTVPTKGEAISAYLQYATEYSYTHVRGYYFERIVKPKFFGTDDSDGHVTKSVTIFVTIIDNLEFDFYTLYSPQLEDITHLWRYTLSNTNSTLEQAYSASKDMYDGALEDMDKWFGLIH